MEVFMNDKRLEYELQQLCKPEPMTDLPWNGHDLTEEEIEAIELRADRWLMDI